jgi:hypothetical protein
MSERSESKEPALSERSESKGPPAHRVRAIRIAGKMPALHNLVKGYFS